MKKFKKYYLSFFKSPPADAMRQALRAGQISFQKGFTFIELILYVGILGIMLGAIVPFSWNAIETGAKSSVMQEVNDNARYVSERLKYEIRNASGINSVAATSISLATNTPATNPTIINLTGGNIQIQQGAGSPITLNSINTSISSLIFTNYTSGDNKTKNIQFAFTLSANFAIGRQEYQDSTTIESDGEVRSN